MTGAGVRGIGKSGEGYAFMQANRMRFSSGALQWEVSIALCPRRRRFAVAKAGGRRDAGRKTAGIRRIPDELPVPAHHEHRRQRYAELYLVTAAEQSVVRRALASLQRKGLVLGSNRRGRNSLRMWTLAPPGPEPGRHGWRATSIA